MGNEPVDITLSHEHGSAGTLATAVVSRVGDRCEVVLRDGRTVPLPLSETPRDRPPERGQRLVVEVFDAPSGLVASCARPEMVELALADVVPEVRDGDIRVLATAREPGVRTKIAVAPTREGLDALATCIGRGASRVKRVGQILGGERIDVIAFHDDDAVLLANALAPAEVSRVLELPDGSLRAVVEDHLLHVALGGGALNVRLARSLVGRRVEVVSASSETARGKPSAAPELAVSEESNTLR